MSVGRRIRVLNVVNKRLPPTDYRRVYPRYSELATASFVAPTAFEEPKTESVTLIGFAEGLTTADLTHFYRLYAYIRANRTRYDLVHFFSTKLALVGPLVAAAAGIPSIVTITGLGRVFNRDSHRYVALRSVYRGLVRCASLFSKAVLFQNRGDMSALTAAVPNLARKAIWVGSGVDSRRVEAKDFDAGPLKVLLVARLMEDKGIKEFVTVAEKLAGDRFEFTLAGPASPGQEALLRQVKDAHERGVINYRGNLGAAELSEVYDLHHVLLFPSRGEGMSRVMLEAGYHLLCPVASAIPANKELITGPNGILLPIPTVVAAACEALLYLERHRNLVEDYASRFQARIAAEFSVEAYARRMDTVLKDIDLVRT
jgi:glycosyltransferase involved in cell wall biosynthesis